MSLTRCNPPVAALHFTRHGQCRQAQRAIPRSVVEQLLATGKRDFDHRGGIRIHLHNRRAQQNCARITSEDALARYRNAYAVVDSANSTVVITVGWCELTRRTDPSDRRRRR